MNSRPETTDIAIVGAGPTGLTLACILAQKRMTELAGLRNRAYL